MATERKRYFLVAEKVMNRQWSNDQLAAIVRLMAYLNARWASDRIDHADAGYAEVCRADVMKISGKHRFDVALKSLRSLADISTISVRLRGEVVVIEWPNFPIFQRYGTRKQGKNRSSDPDPDPDPAREAQECARARARAPALAVEACWEPSPKLLADLGAHDPQGIHYEPEQIRAWAIEMASRARLKGYTSIARTLRNWWPRATWDEVTAAVEAKTTRALERIRRERAPPAETIEDDEGPFRELAGGVIGGRKK